MIIPDLTEMWVNEALHFHVKFFTDASYDPKILK